MISKLSKISFPKSSGTSSEGIPSWAKGIAVVAGILAVGAVGVVIYTSVKKAKDNKGNKLEEATTGADLLVEMKSIKPTITPSQAATAANKIFTALNGWATDEAAVVDAFSIVKNNVDFLLISKAWGTRTVSSGKGNPEPDFTGGLTGAITEDMSAGEIKVINDALAKKGIKYRV